MTDRPIDDEPQRQPWGSKNINKRQDSSPGSGHDGSPAGGCLIALLSLLVRATS